ncbi:uncharacterized protein LOC133893316 isoform X2 [Phragmites australis]|uniref:uncharacterized protein LOC133893316 isoform X2 n=1 Tax=Phragmites australis TaxID=29695 RepID=UPI002D776ED0|nr:uncharacterized protein LOC133893316 isoform X2 [Phragmites australis]
MALRYLARRAGIPALRRASGPHVSGRSRPLTPSTSQGGHSNGAGVGGTRKPVKDAGKRDHQEGNKRSEVRQACDGGVWCRCCGLRTVHYFG